MPIKWSNAELPVEFSGRLLMQSKHKSFVFDSANYITTENRKFRHLSISSQPRKPYHIKRNNTNNYRYYFSLCLAFENIRRSSVVSYSTFLTIQSADLIKRKEKNESFAQWDTNICTSYGTFSYMRMASKNAREMNKSWQCTTWEYQTTREGMQL